MHGADTVVRDLIRAAVGKIFDRYFGDADTQQIELWFNLGGTIKFDDSQLAESAFAELKEIQGLVEMLTRVEVKKSDAPQKIVAAAEFLLEGLVSHRKLSRNEERTFASEVDQQRKQERH